MNKIIRKKLKIGIPIIAVLISLVLMLTPTIAQGYTNTVIGWQVSNGAMLSHTNGLYDYVGSNNNSIMLTDVNETNWIEITSLTISGNATIQIFDTYSNITLFYISNNFANNTIGNTTIIQWNSTIKLLALNVQYDLTTLSIDGYTFTANYTASEMALTGIGQITFGSAILFYIDTTFQNSMNNVSLMIFSIVMLLAFTMIIIAIWKFAGIDE